MLLTIEKYMTLEYLHYLRFLRYICLVWNLFLTFIDYMPSIVLLPQVSFYTLTTNTGIFTQEKVLLKDLYHSLLLSTAWFLKVDAMKNAYSDFDKNLGKWLLPS